MFSGDEVLSASQLTDVRVLVICAMIVLCVMMNSLLQAKLRYFCRIYWQLTTAATRLFDADVTSS